MAPGGGAREGDTQGGAHGCAAGAAARRAGRFHVQQRRSWGAAALLVPLASRGCRCSRARKKALAAAGFARRTKQGRRGLGIRASYSAGNVSRRPRWTLSADTERGTLGTVGRPGGGPQAREEEPTSKGGE